MMELWCVFGSVKCRGEIKFENFCGIKEHSEEENLEKIRYKIEQEKENFEGRASRRKPQMVNGYYLEGRLGSLNFRSCVFVPLLKKFENGQRMNSLFQEQIIEERDKADFGRLGRLFTEAAGELSKLGEHKRRPDASARKTFKRAARVLRGIIKFKKPEERNEQEKLEFQKDFSLVNVSSRVQNETSLKLFVLKCNEKVLNFEEILSQVEILAHGEDYRQAGYEEEDVDKLMKRLLLLGSYLDQDSNWLTKIIEGIFKQGGVAE